MEEKPTLVIAAYNYAQAQEVAIQERLLPGWRYLRGPQTLLGLEAPAVLYLFGWQEQPQMRGHVEKFLALLGHRGGSEVSLAELDPWRREVAGG